MKNKTIGLTIYMLLIGFIGYGQSAKELPKDWHLHDLQESGYFGVSLDKALQLVKGKKSNPVIVAVIDSGIDTNQVDLKSKLWRNKKEIPANGKDDDKNGYIDDIYGWNFLGGNSGETVIKETSEEVRLFASLKDKFEKIDSLTVKSKEYVQWKKIKNLRDQSIKHASEELNYLKPLADALKYTSILIANELKINPQIGFVVSDLKNLKSTNDTLTQANALWQSLFNQKPNESSVSIMNELDEYLHKLNLDINPDLEVRKRIIGDNPDDNSNPYYGNNLLTHSDAQHGTAVAGLIAADRNNNYGIKGIADNVRIMAIKAVPDGDEYDKDVANAIKYAVNNGAKVINLSFGKKISPQKEWVDEAFKYAAEKNVLIVQAAGNEGESLQEVVKYPNDTFKDGSSNDAENVICVGASSAFNNEMLPANFSNYSKTDVDVFAPGHDVTSVTLNKEFLTASGTSFSSPVTAGIAALILSYYPKLSAAEVKNIILNSAIKLKDLMVTIPGKSGQSVSFSTLSKTGGVVNAYEAIKLASTYKK